MATTPLTSNPFSLVRRTGLYLVAVLVASLALGAAGASAGTITGYDYWQVTYNAGAGEANNVTVAHSGDTLTLTDSGVVNITDGDAGDDCTVVGNIATCVQPNADAFDLYGDLNDMSDSWNSTAVNGENYAQITGGAGDDTIKTGSTYDWINGGTENDNIDAGDGGTYSFGDAGNDTIVAAKQADSCCWNDTMWGGSGDDNLTSNAGVDVWLSQLYGEAGADTLTVNNAHNQIFGGSENDIIKSNGGGWSQLFGEGGDDTLNSPDPTDDCRWFIGGSGNDVLTGGDSPCEWSYGEDGNDTINGGAGDYDAMYGQNGNDTLNGGDGYNQMYGNANDDTLNGGKDDDYLEDQEGSNSITGSAGNDFAYTIWATTTNLDLGIGNDGSYFGSPGAAVLGTGDDWIVDYWTESNQTFNGDDGDDYILPGRGDDAVNGGQGDDYFDGNWGPYWNGSQVVSDTDVIDGGLGRDLSQHDSWFNDATDQRAANISLDGVANDGYGPYDNGTPGDPTDDVPAENDNFVGIEDVRTDNGYDTLTGSEVDNMLDAGAGNDVVNGLGGDDDLLAGPGPWGTAPDKLDTDTLVGGDGMDQANYSNRNCWDSGCSRGVDVTLDGVANDGNPVDDQGTVDISDDVLAENDSLDTENVVGSWYDDNLTGSEGNNSLFGYGGNDVLNGLGGADSLQGGWSADGLAAGGGDFLIGGAGDDTADLRHYTVPVSVSLDGVANDGSADEGDNVQADVEIIEGGEEDDTLTGSSGPNMLSGNAGRDTLSGLAGDDILIGGTGEDNLSGGDGSDRLLSRDAFVDAVACGTGRDSVIADVLDVINADCDDVSSNGLPTLTLAAKSKQKVLKSKAILIDATVNEAGTLVASATLTGVTKKLVKVSNITVGVTAAGTTRLNLNLSTGQLKAIAKGLAKKKKAKKKKARKSSIAAKKKAKKKKVAATVTVKFTDRSGNLVTKSLKIAIGG